ncbi:hypothetical protein HPB48_004425 [Haemaphysalis longicornis]|uniref:Uncharacterized protein n=1 Tax=Haemaphysalis longicornis TaxID=44386 RepID=A0A9J6FSM9_HAELO|nr:hypothetical protein HPB48_004425 [Haemaphysalis longicornis]
MACFLVIIEDGNGNVKLWLLPLCYGRQGNSPLVFQHIQRAQQELGINLHFIYVRFTPFKLFEEKSAYKNLAYQDLCKRLDLLQRMAYARSEEEYDHLYRTLKSSSPPAVVDYFNSNWHDIHAEWIMAIKWSCGNFMNFTNNRADSINGKLKTIVDRYSSLENFARNVFFICALHKERGRAQGSNDAAEKASNVKK